VGANLDDLVVSTDVLSVAARPTPHSWEWYGPATIDYAGKEFAGFVDLRHHEDGAARGRFLPNSNTDGIPALVERATLRPITPSNANWKAEITLARDDTLEQVFRLELSPESIPREHAESTLWRIVYFDMPLPAFRFGPWREKERGQTRMFYSTFTAFGRTFCVHELLKSDGRDDKVSMLSVTYGGKKITAQELDAVETTLFLLAGNGGRRASEEGYSKNAALQERSTGQGRSSMSLFPKEIFPRQLFLERDLNDWVPPLVHRAADLLRSGFPLRPILFHLFSSQIAQPEITLLFLGVMREAMLPRLGSGESVLFQDFGEWQTRIEPVVRALAENFADVDPKTLSSLEQRIRNLNDVSIKRRRDAFWGSVKIQPSPEELAILKHRDDVSHSGYILDTYYDEAIQIANGGERLPPYAERLAQLQKDSMIYRNLMVRSLLRVWGYEGQIRDAGDWSKMLDV